MSNIFDKLGYWILHSSFSLFTNFGIFTINYKIKYYLSLIFLTFSKQFRIDYFVILERV